jgi:uncharacterized protein (TIGR03437 family)
MLLALALFCFSQPDGSFTTKSAIASATARNGDTHLYSIKNDQVEVQVQSNLWSQISDCASDSVSVQPPLISNRAHASAPTNFATPDWNGDGRPDYFGMANQSLRAGLYVGGSAYQSVTVPTLAGPVQMIATADLTRDGRDDAVILHGGKISIIDGTPTGVLGQPRNFAISFTATSIYLADLNRDGVPDLLVGRGDDSPGVAIYYSNGTGSFEVTNFIGAFFPVQQVLAIDQNGDQLVDVIARSDNQLTVYAQTATATGGGDFQTYAFTSMPPARNVMLTDLNGDPFLDLVLLINNSYVTYFAQARGTFQRAGIYSGGFNPTGRLQQVTVNQRRFLVHDAGTLGFQWTPILTEALGSVVGTAVPVGGQRILSTDWNNDGIPDSVTVGDDSLVLTVSAGSRFNNFQYPIVGLREDSIQLLDVSGDEFTDLVFQTEGSSDWTIQTLENNSRGGVAAGPRILVRDLKGKALTGVADLNRDGRGDLLLIAPKHFTSGTATDAIGILMQNGNGQFAAPTYLRSGQNTVAVGIAGEAATPSLIALNDVPPRPGSPDPLLNFLVLLPQDRSGFQAPRWLSPGYADQLTRPRDFIVQDFNGDRRVDFRIIADPLPNNADTQARQYFISGSELLSPLPNLVSKSISKNVAIDTNGDTFHDVFRLIPNLRVDWGNAVNTLEVGREFAVAGTDVVFSQNEVGERLLLLDRIFETESVVYAMRLPGKPVQRPATAVNGAGFGQSETLAPGSLVSIFGNGMADSAAGALTQPLPKEIAGTRVDLLTDDGAILPVDLLWVWRTQVNIVLPSDARSGTLRVSAPDGSESLAKLKAAPFSPGLLTVPSGLPVGEVIRVRRGQRTSLPYVQQPIAGVFEAVPIVYETGDELTLVLYGTGFRNRGSNAVSVRWRTLGGEPFPQPNTVEFAGPQGQFAGLDQLNVRLNGAPARGDVLLEMAIDGKVSNTVRLSFQ